MSNFDLLPAINQISIQLNDDAGNLDKADIDLYKSKENVINYSFGISGLSKLKQPISDHVVPFYLFTAITFQNGGKEYEIISLADILVDDYLISQHNIRFNGELSIPPSKIYENDFVNTAYYFTIVHTHKEITSEKELNLLLSSYESSLFRTKLNIEIKE